MMEIRTLKQLRKDQRCRTPPRESADLTGQIWELPTQFQRRMNLTCNECLSLLTRMEKLLSCPPSNFFSSSSYRNSRTWRSWQRIKKNYSRPLILMICRISIPSTSMKFSIKAACKFRTNPKRLIERTNACTSLIITKTQTTTKTWALCTRRREQLTTSRRIISKTSVPNLRFLELAMLSTRTMISPQMAWLTVRGRIWLAMICERIAATQTNSTTKWSWTKWASVPA